MKLNKKSLIIVLIVLILLMSFLSQSAHAAYNDYIVNINIDTGTTDSDVGEIVVRKGNMVYENHYINSVNDITISKGDKLYWNGTGNLTLYDSSNNQESSPLESGQFKIYNNPGNYKIKIDSMTANVHVDPEPELRQSLEITSEHLNFNYDNSEFIITGTKYYDISLNMTNLDNRVYEYQVKINDGILNRVYNNTIEIGSILDWSITQNNMSNYTQLKAGDYENIGFLKLTNNGNDNEVIDVTVRGNIKDFINVRSSYDLFEGNDAYINIIAQIPTKQENKIVSGEIVLSNLYHEEIIPITLDIRDLIKPEINNIEFEHNYLIKNNKITLNAMDNIDVARVSLSFKNTTLNMTKDNQIFTAVVAFNETVDVNFCAYDTSNNTYCEVAQKSFLPLDCLINNTNFDLPTVKTNNYASRLAFELTEDTNNGFNISISRFSSENGENPSFSNFEVRLIHTNGDVYQFDSINTTYQLTTIGKYNLEVKSENVTSYEGQIKFVTSNLISDYKNIYFNGNIAEYQIPEYMIDKNWGGKHTLECIPQDEGNLEDSYITCTVTLPANADLDTTVIPMSIQQKDLLNQEIEDLKNEKISLGLKFTFVIVFLLALLVVMTGIGWFMTNIKPRMVWIKGKRQ